MRSAHYRLLKRLTYVPGVRSLWRRFPFGSLGTRTWFGISHWPQYAWGVFAAAELANRLGLPGISVLEFGVGAGHGLLGMESVAAEVTRYFDLPITVLGVLTEHGRPAPVDYRDLPHVWTAGERKIDSKEVRQRLTSAELILGDLASAVPQLMGRGDLHPIGFAAFDLGYYSLAMQALRIFEGQSRLRLPRVYTYFNNILLPESACFNDYIGELCAIREFNEAHDDRKLCPIHLLRHMQPHPASWHDQIYVMHDFGHPLYARNIVQAPHGAAGA